MLSRFWAVAATLRSIWLAAVPLARSQDHGLLISREDPCKASSMHRNGQQHVAAAARLSEAARFCSRLVDLQRSAKPVLIANKMQKRVLAIFADNKYYFSCFYPRNLHITIQPETSHSRVFLKSEAPNFEVMKYIADFTNSVSIPFHIRVQLYRVHPRLQNELSLICVAATDEVADDTIVVRPITRLIRKALARSQAFGKVADTFRRIFRKSKILFKPCEFPNAV